MGTRPVRKLARDILVAAAASAGILIAFGMFLGYLFWAGTARAQALGDHGNGHREMHSDYKDWRTPTGYSCCDDHDCRPTRVCEPTFGGLGVIADGRCILVRPHSLIKVPSPDGRTHVCMTPGAIEPRCVVIGEPRI